jgi:hypothetical protein
LWSKDRGTAVPLLERTQRESPAFPQYTTQSSVMMAVTAVQPDGSPTKSLSRYERNRNKYEYQDREREREIERGRLTERERILNREIPRVKKQKTY